MQLYLINGLIVLAAVIGMEAVAWVTHKYVMHGLLWRLHQDHHKKKSVGFFEHNDLFFLIFAVPSFTLSLLGMKDHYNFLFYIGIGVAIYGAIYFLVHDIIIHQRFKLFRHTDNAYLKAIRRAHKVHHKHLTKEDGECFGMLWVPFKYFRTHKTSASA